MTSGLTLAALAVVAAVVWLVARMRDPETEADPDAIDHELLDEAEREVRDLDAFADPEDADDQLPDWGPGAPH